MNFKLSNFYVRSGIFTILSGTAALLNYLLYPAISRILDTASFGNFTALNALFTQILGILLAFNLTSIYIVKTFPEKEARSYAQAIQRLLIWLFVGISLLFLVSSPLLGAQLKIDSPASFLVVTLMLLSAVPAVIWTGYLQGHKQLVNVGVFNFSGALAKLALALILASLFGATGGLAGVLVGTLLGLLLMKFTTSRKLPSLASIFHKLSKPQLDFLHSAKYYIFGSVLIVGGLTVLQNLDITYAKYFFSPEIAGAYSGVSILSNALYYILFLLIWIIIPEIDPAQKEHNKRLLGNTYKLIILVGAVALIVASVFQQFIVGFLLGDSFAQFNQLLFLATLYQVGLVAITFYAYYLLILRNRRSLVLGLCIIIPCFFAPHIFAESPRSLITSLCVSMFSGFGIYLLIALLLDKRRKYV